jgi:hypothetical protein
LLHQFVEESALDIALLQAGVKYKVRVSTYGEYVGPTKPVFYGRSPWAIETLLSQPEFESMHQRSLQPNFFTTSYRTSTMDWIKAYQKTHRQETLAIILSANAAVAMSNPKDVSNVGAHLLAL